VNPINNPSQFPDKIPNTLESLPLTMWTILSKAVAQRPIFMLLKCANTDAENVLCLVAEQSSYYATSELIQDFIRCILLIRGAIKWILFISATAV
jgi:hypothetical protein